MDAEALSPFAEDWLAQLADRFYLELANHDIGAKHACKFDSYQEAMLAMLRLAYLKGREDAQPPDTRTFEETVADVEAANARVRQ